MRDTCGKHAREPEVSRANCLERTGVNLIGCLMCLFPRLVNETDVVLYCDFHGHNRKNNIFMYGCSTRGDNSPKLQERVFPLMMSKNASNKVELVKLFTGSSRD